MRQPLKILVLSDGKPGHQNQSLGLAEAIGRMGPAEIRVRRVGRCRPCDRADGSACGRPDLLLGAGHATHLPLLRLARCYGAPTVVLMKPTLPTFLFDLCLVPEHDLRRRHAARVIPTRGALNLIPPPGAEPRERGLILLGGPSRNHGWDGEKIRDCVAAIVRACPDLAWDITDSRRSPLGTLEGLRAVAPKLAIFPHAETGPGWVAEHLAGAAQVWVSEDSVSMVYEALSSGAAVGLLPVPARKPSNKLIKSLARLEAEGYATAFADWTPGTPLPSPPRVLREADRCATIVLDRLFPSRHS